jgi:hypothetical protein
MVIVGVNTLRLASASVSSAVCNGTNSSGGQTCLNRRGGGTGLNTDVIGWRADHDDNEDFSFQYLTGMCPQRLPNGSTVSGYVSSTCPFTVGSGFNNKYLGNPIVQIRSARAGKCLGNDGGNDNLGGLQTCNNLSGSGGGGGTIFVWNVPGGNGPTYYLENRYWTNVAAKSGITVPGWLCSNYGASSARSVSLDSSGNGANCAWRYY